MARRGSGSAEYIHTTNSTRQQAAKKKTELLHACTRNATKTIYRLLLIGREMYGRTTTRSHPCVRNTTTMLCGRVSVGMPQPLLSPWWQTVRPFSRTSVCTCRGVPHSLRHLGRFLATVLCSGKRGFFLGVLTTSHQASRPLYAHGGDKDNPSTSHPVGQSTSVPA